MNANARSGLNRLLWTIATGSLILIILSFGSRMYQQRQYRQAEKQTFEKLQTLASQADYDPCIETVSSISVESKFYRDAQDILHQCILGSGKQLAETGKIRSALTLWLSLPEDAKNKTEAETLIETLSTDLINQSQAKIEEGDLDEAILILAQIPLEAPATATAQNLRESWRNEWEKNEAAVKQAETEISKGEWLAAQTSLQKVTLNPYWQTQIAPLKKQAEAGIDQVLRYEKEQTEQEQQRQQAETESNIFNDRLESLAETYVSEGMEGLEAWRLACETVGGTIVDEGPSDLCTPP